ncbi:tyrosine-type recombinase/integrase [Corynebacterium casei]|uniref:tyrosine-type recombinase/integrase n=1 Tax=Corynebacterium casei TaxID=160386 RepID=UPI003BB7F988
MAIEKRQFKDEVIYRVRIHQRGRIVASRNFDDYDAARAWESQQKLLVRRGFNVSAAALPVEVYVERWLSMRGDSAPATIRRQDSLLELWVLPRWAGVPLDQIRRSDVRLWAKEVASLRSPSTARLAVGVLRQVLSVACDDGLLQSNPAENVRLQSRVANLPRPLTHEQLHLLAAAMPTETYRVLTLVLGYSGLRIGEAIALDVPDFLEERGSLSVYRAYSLTGEGEKRRLGPTKTSQTRVVPLPQVIQEDLRSYVIASSTERTNKTRETDIANTPLFFDSQRDDKRVYPGNYKDTLIALCSKLDIPRITPHNLRDTCATLAINAGATAPEVAQLLGHSSSHVTLTHYGHFFENGLSSVASRLDEQAVKFSKRAP